jgi:hypothetical protein
MNPFAAEFVPMNSIKHSKNNKNKALDTLRSLSMTVAENVLQPISHRTFELTPVHKELLAKRALEDKIIKIPTITSVDGLEQVAQISYNHETGVDLWELFWDGTHAILDNRISSWQFPDMPISDIIHYYFDEETSVTISPDCAAPASYAPGIQIVVTPIFPDEAYWSEHRWKIIP